MTTQNYREYKNSIISERTHLLTRISYGATPIFSKSTPGPPILGPSTRSSCTCFLLPFPPESLPFMVDARVHQYRDSRVTDDSSPFVVFDNSIVPVNARYIERRCTLRRTLIQLGFSVHPHCLASFFNSGCS